MIVSLTLAALLGAVGAPDGSLTLTPRPASLELSWADAEDRLVGSIVPAHPNADSPFTVSVYVGVVEGAEFTGPLTFSLRRLDQLGGAVTSTEARPATAKAWQHAFTVDEPGQYVLEVSFSTTHRKVVRGVIEVESATVPRGLGLAVGSGLIIIALALGVFQLFRSREAELRPQVELADPAVVAAEMVAPTQVTPSSPVPPENGTPS